MLDIVQPSLCGISAGFLLNNEWQGTGVRWPVHYHLGAVLGHVPAGST